MWKVRALDMINGLNGGSVEPVLTSIHISLKKQTNRKKKKSTALFGRTVAMETKDQDVSHRGMVTSGRERPCFAIPDTITQQRDRGNGAMVI